MIRFLTPLSMNGTLLKLCCVVLLSVWMLSGSVCAQDAQKVISSINDQFIQKEKYSLDMSFNVYSSYTSKKPISTSKCVYYKSGNSYRSEIEGVVTIQNQNHLMTLDPFMEKILISEASKEKISPLPVASMDSILKYFYSSSITKINDGEGRLTLTYKEEVRNSESYSRVEMFYNSNSFIPSRIIFYYAQEVELDDVGKQTGKPRLEILVNQFDYQVTISPTLFSLKPFVVKKNNQFLASSNYRNYEVNDIRIKK